jgi:hypothetical protein
MWPAADHVGNEFKRAGRHELDGCAEGVADSEAEESAASAVGYVVFASFHHYLHLPARNSEGTHHSALSAHRPMRSARTLSAAARMSCSIRTFGWCTETTPIPRRTISRFTKW